MANHVKLRKREFMSDEDENKMGTKFSPVQQVCSSNLFPVMCNQQLFTSG